MPHRSSPNNTSVPEPLLQISALDGRYAAQVDSLRPLLSEYGLIHHRLLVEIRWLQYCATHKDLGAPNLDTTELHRLDALYQDFGLEDCRRIKAIEKRCHHDVKAVEIFVCERLEDVINDQDGKKQAKLHSLRAWVHFACTSDDINNLAWALILKSVREVVLLPAYTRFSAVLDEYIDSGAQASMLARTHGQAASPTTMGKELAVFSWRIDRQRAHLQEQAILAKFNGAVGNYNAHHLAYPELNWPQISKHFVESLGLQWAPISTQIEARDWMAELFDTMAHLNNVLLDLCRDMWGYIALGYFRQKPAGSEEVGSSTMPHKINPIDFENAEGNLGIANSLLRHLSDKLPISRWQRDLSDSTTMRNIGSAIGHGVLAVASIERGMRKTELDSQCMRRDLDKHWSVLAEGIQTVMRRCGISDAYAQLKTLTRAQDVDRQILHDFIESSNIPDKDKQHLLTLKPEDYLGLATHLSKQTHRKINK